MKNGALQIMKQNDNILLSLYVVVQVGSLVIFYRSIVQDLKQLCLYQDWEHVPVTQI